jgi:short-subunit dehydrogenase
MRPEAMDLRDKVVLITGASEGIGAACVRVFRARGAKLALVARSREKLEAVAGADALAIPGDLLNGPDRQQAVETTLAHYGRIDVLVNNAGVGLYAPAWKAPPDEVRRMFDLNLFAVLDLIQRVAPLMQQQRSGTIVNVSSIAGKVPLAWFTLYSASKFALSAMTTGLRMELRSYGIHCMDVCPGYVKTGFQQHVLTGQPPDRLWRMRRFAITAEQCAQALVRGVERRKRTVIVPRAGWLLMAARALFPGLVESQMERIYLGLNMQ